MESRQWFHFPIGTASRQTIPTTIGYDRANGLLYDIASTGGSQLPPRGQGLEDFGLSQGKTCVLGFFVERNYEVLDLMAQSKACQHPALSKPNIYERRNPTDLITPQQNISFVPTIRIPYFEELLLQRKPSPESGAMLRIPGNKIRVFFLCYLSFSLGFAYDVMWEVGGEVAYLNSESPHPIGMLFRIIPIERGPESPESEEYG
jgi:hypothetical protein